MPIRQLLYRLIRHPLWLTIVFLATAPGGLQAQPPASKEFQIKAAFLYNFVQFVEWPESVFAKSDSPLSIGILGDNPFGNALDEIVRGETIHGHVLTVRHGRRLEELQNCQVVFISQSERYRLGDIMSRLDNSSVLTVSDIDGFTQRGGIIKFFLEGNKVRFEINPDAAQREGLKISSELLSLGKVDGVGPTNGKN